ncbi:MAG: NAD-dependent epimerase/dehydratase family protein, partial [Candidatus Heimdallarchaeaceae archaeon]
KKTNFEVFWGDIRNINHVKEIVEGVDYIIHLAAVIPPEADRRKKYAFQVNVEGTRNLIESASKQKRKPKIIFTSSIAIYGSRQALPPPRKVSEEPKPLEHDEYAKHKIAMEKMLQNSSLEWVIFRLGVVPSLRMPIEIPKIMYDVPFDQRLEFVHTRDVALACVNAIKTPEVFGKILNVAGGEKCRMTAREYITTHLETFGVGAVPREVFRIPKNDEDWFHTDFMDTEESKRLLHYQRYTLEDFSTEYRAKIATLRKFISYIRPIAKLVIVLRSPYYFKNKRRNRKKKTK